jgi:hypothetical protein
MGLVAILFIAAPLLGLGLRAFDYVRDLSRSKLPPLRDLGR